MMLRICDFFAGLLFAVVVGGPVVLSTAIAQGGAVTTLQSLAIGGLVYCVAEILFRGREED